MGNNTCTVVVNSCDKYEDAWYPFFELFKKYWIENKYPIVLNTECKKYTHPHLNIRTINYCHDQNYWGERFINSLTSIDSEYVLLLLEDFFFLDYVNQPEIDKCLEWMEKDEEITAIYFKKITGYEQFFNKDYIYMKENKRYKLNLQAGLWRRRKLIELLDRCDSPWDFEEEGYVRVDNSKHKFYCSSKGSHFDTSENVFKYLVARDFGYGIWKGKWLWNNKTLLKNNGIESRKISMETMRKNEYYIWKIKKRIIDFINNI